MKITNISRALQGVNTVGGGVTFIPPGEAREVDVAYEDRQAVEKLPFFRIGDVEDAKEVGDDGRNADGDTPEMAEMRKRFDASYAEQGRELELARNNVAERDQTIADLQEQLAAAKSAQKPNDGDAAPVYSVKEKTAGWLVIVDANGAEVTKSLRKEAVDGFDAKSDEDKAAFVAANKTD